MKRGRWSTGLLLLAVLLATGIRSASAQDDAEGSGLFEANGRTCTALAVFHAAHDSSWLAMAAVAQTVANAVEQTGVVDACTLLPEILGQSFPIAAPSLSDFSEWHTALEVTDAVLSGDYTIAPATCAAANTFRAEAPTRADVLPSVCRVGGLFFFVEPAAHDNALRLATSLELPQ